MIKPDMATTASQPTQVLVIGGGFGGVRAARRLAGHSGAQVTLISADDNFTYYPQLYHAASGGSRLESAIPLTQLLGDRPVTVIKDTITIFDPAAQTVTGTSGQVYHYDELVLAMGNVTNYFGIQGLEEFSYNIKSIAGAERFKQHLHKQLVDDKKPDVNYVIVGGGPTGVELAAALGSYLRRIVALHHLPAPKYQIDLVEAAPRLLPRSPEAMSARVQRRLEALGVRVMTAAVVKGETAATLQLEGQSIATHTVVWTAGVANNPFFKANTAHFTLAKNGKVEVDEHLQALPHVYVIGDNAATQYSGMAQTALHNADYTAKDIIRVIRDRARVAYRPSAPISVIPVGEHWAATQWGSLLLYGFIGFVLRSAADLIGYADLQPWPQALKLWLQDSRHEDNCAICSPQPVS